jgi:hypothetical protein
MNTKNKKGTHLKKKVAYEIPKKKIACKAPKIIQKHNKHNGTRAR